MVILLVRGPPSRAVDYPTNAIGTRDRQTCSLMLSVHGLESAHVRPQGPRHLCAGRAGVPGQARGRHAAGRRAGAACAAARYVLGEPHGTGPADDAPVLLRGKALRSAFILRALAIERWVRGVVLALLGVAVFKLKSTQVSLQDLFERDLKSLDPFFRQIHFKVSDSTTITLDREGPARQVVDAEPDRDRADPATARCRSSRASACGRSSAGASTSPSSARPRSSRWRSTSSPRRSAG